MQPGIYKGLSFNEYLSIPAINKSGLEYFKQSPAHFYEYCLKPGAEKKEATPAMKLGTGIHTAILEPERFKTAYVIAPKVDRRTKEGKATWEAFVAENEGREYLTSEQLETCQRVASGIKENPAASVLFEDGSAEVTMIWEIPLSDGTKILAKGRLDWFSETSQVLIDLKSTESAAPDDFAKQVANFDWHVQAAFYLDGIKSLTGADHTFIMGALEKSAPYASAFYMMPEEVIEVGRLKYKRLLSKYIRSMKSNEWNAYPHEIMSLYLPSWAMKDVHSSTDNNETEAPEALTY